MQSISFYFKRCPRIVCHKQSIHISKTSFLTFSIVNKVNDK